MSSSLSKRFATEFLDTSEGKIRLLKHSISPAYPWLILGPGQGDSSESLLMLFDLAGQQELNIALFDPPGHGLSDEPRTDYSVDSQLSVWMSVLTHLQADRAYIGGYSYGAYSAAMCSSALSHRILGLVLIEGGYLTLEQRGITSDEETTKIISSMRAFRYNSRDEAREAIQSQTTTWSDDDEAEFESSVVERDGAIVQRTTERTIILMEQTLGDYSTVVLQTLACPILVMHATLPAEKSEMRSRGLAVLSEHAPHAKIVPIPNCGHNIKEHLPFVMDQIVNLIHDDMLI